MANTRMTDSGQAARPVRAPLQRRHRRRWAIAGGAAAGWLVADRITGSFVTALLLLIVLAVLGAAAAAGLRAMGITRDHPWLRRLATRPWRDGQDVLSLAMRHLSDVFVVTSSGSLLAPEFVELQLNPDDLASLQERIEPGIVSISLAEAYEDQAARCGARFTGRARPEVYIIPDDSVPQGRYRLRRGLPPASAGPVKAEPYGHAQVHARPEAVHPRPEAEANQKTIMDGMVTVMEQIRPAVPVLRLVTGSSVAETSTSGARAGRGPVELELPNLPTVSRVHAVFVFDAGRWWVTSKGMNGLLVNGIQVPGKHPLSDGDSIRWGTKPDAPLSRVTVSRG